MDEAQCLVAEAEDMEMEEQIEEMAGMELEVADMYGNMQVVELGLEAVVFVSFNIMYMSNY